MIAYVYAAAAAVVTVVVIESVVHCLPCKLTLAMGAPAKKGA